MIRLFTPARCMFASNWHLSAAFSNSDDPGATDALPGLTPLYQKFHAWVFDLPHADQAALFGGTAKAFYGF